MFLPASNITGPQVQKNLVALEGEVCSIQTSESSKDLFLTWIYCRILYNFTECYTRAIIVAFFLLMFYALALWDRWMHLKSKELEKLSSKFLKTIFDYLFTYSQS